MIYEPGKGGAETCYRNEQCDGHRVLKIVLYLSHHEALFGFLMMQVIAVIKSER